MLLSAMSSPSLFLILLGLIFTFPFSISISSPSSDDELRAINLLISRRDWSTLKTLALSAIASTDFTSVSNSPTLVHHYYLGVALYYLGEDLNGAIDAFTTASLLSPDNPTIHGSLGESLMSQFRCSEAEKSFAKAYELDRDWTWYVKMLKARDWVGDYSPLDVDRDELVELLSDGGSSSGLTEGDYYDFMGFVREGIMYETTFSDDEVNDVKGGGGGGGGGGDCGDCGDCDGDMILRVGFISSDFGVHPVSTLIRGLIQHLSSPPLSSRVQITLFSLTPSSSWWCTNMTATVGAEQFVALVGMTTNEKVAAVKAREIDVLIDLNGKTLNSGLDIFDGRPANIQVSFLGLPQTTLHPSIDYYIGDSIGLAPDWNLNLARKHFVEKLSLVVTCYGIVSDYASLQGHTHWRYPMRPYASPPTTTTTTTTTTRYHLLACTLSNIQKMSPDVFDIWANILREEPRMRLAFMKYKGWEEGKIMIEREFRGRGVEPQKRLVWVEQVSQPDGGGWVRLGCGW